MRNNNKILILDAIIITIGALFFLITLAISIFLVLGLIAPGLPPEYAANSMWIGLVPPVILSIVFLRFVLSKLHSKLLYRWLNIEK